MSFPFTLFTLFTLLSFLVPFAIGFLVVSVLWPTDRSLFSDLPFKCCLSVGFGFGSSSCVVFIWILIAGRLTRGVFACEFLLLAVLCVLVLFRRQRSTSSTCDRPEGNSSFGRPYLLRLAVLGASVSAVLRFCYLSLQEPHGGPDAYATWNQRARFLYRGGDHWKDFTYLNWSHPDYPLLIPASIARAWDFVGRETQLIPVAVGLLFTVATIGIVAFSIARLRGERQGLLAGLILLGTPFFILHGASQYADVPLSFFFAATVALLFFHAESPSQMRFLTLAGMAAGFSAWTKNEGALFLALLSPLHFVVTTVAKGRRDWGREVAALLMGAAPVIVVIGLFKVCVAATNDLVAGQGAGSVAKLLDVSRYHMVLSWFARELFEFGGWSPTFAVPLLLLFYFLLLRTSVEKRNVPAAGIAVLLLAFMLAGHFFIYILTPHDLEWHLETSLNRLLLQVWPLAICAYFAIVRTPEEAFAAAGIHERGENKSEWRRWLLCPEVASAAFIIGAVLFKIRIVQLARTGPTFFAVVQQDAAIFTFLLLIYEVGRIAARRDRGRDEGRAAKAILARLCIVACLFVLLLYAADAFAYCFLGTRLQASDIVTFVSEPRSALAVLRPGWQAISDLSAKRLGAFAVVILLMLGAYYTLLAQLVAVGQRIDLSNAAMPKKRYQSPRIVRLERRWSL